MFFGCPVRGGKNDLKSYNNEMLPLLYPHPGPDGKRKNNPRAARIDCGIEQERSHSMETLGRNNYARLCGTLAGPPTLSHENRQERFFRFPLRTQRLSGAFDTVNVLAREWLLLQTDLAAVPRLEVTGEVRTFNNQSGDGARLVISLFARRIALSDAAEDENLVLLTGTLCKMPVLRRTPLGRDICDLMVAVNRNYGRSDYLPCLAWGERAYAASRWGVGTAVSLTGRLQSRDYRKTLEDGTVQDRTAFEISIMEIERT